MKLIFLARVVQLTEISIIFMSFNGYFQQLQLIALNVKHARIKSRLNLFEIVQIDLK